MPTQEKNKPFNRAALFDWLVLCICFLLGFIFPTLRDFIFSPRFSNWIFAALVLYITGAALKHLPLSYRLTYSATAVQPIPYLLFLLAGHWCIILFAVILSESAIRHLLALPPLVDKNMGGGAIIIGSILTASFVTWMVYRTKSHRKKTKKYPARNLFWMENIADAFLVAGVSIFSFIFWEKGAIAMLSKGTVRSIGDIWFLLVFLTILFVFFYLPLRYLFFMEARGGTGNRQRLLLFFGFMLLKALFRGLGI